MASGLPDAQPLRGLAAYGQRLDDRPKALELAWSKNLDLLKTQSGSGPGAPSQNLVLRIGGYGLPAANSSELRGLSPINLCHLAGHR